MSHHPLTVELWSPSLPQSFQLLRLSGYEAISECFDLSLHFAPPDAEVDVDACLKPGTRAAVVFKRHDQVIRVIHGCLLELETRSASAESSDVPAGWVARFAPRLWSSKFQIHTQVHDGPLHEIVERVLRRSGLHKGLDYEFRLAETYPSREFAFQYKESDFAFVSRLLEHWGIAFSFEHGTRDRVIFTDGNAAMLDIACWRAPAGDAGERDPEGDVPENPSAGHKTTTTLQFTQFGGSEEAASDSVVEHSRRTQRVPARFATHDYNYRLPHVRLEAQHEVLEQGDGSVVEHGLHPKLPDEAAHFAKIRAELLGSARILHRGIAGSPLLRAGGSFRLHPDSEGNDTSLLVHRVEHCLAGTYSARFHAQPTEATYRPALLTPRPVIAGYLSGVVQGEDPVRPNLDAQGRYQVAFNCEDDQPDGQRPRRPMRMLQSHAGANYGMHFPLKPGTEVAIGFMNGDPDRPFIAGALPNPITPSPVRGERGNLRRNVIQSMNGVRVELDDGSR